MLGARSPVCQNTARRRESYAMCVKHTRLAARASVQLRNAPLAHLTILGSRHTILLGFLGEDVNGQRYRSSARHARHVDFESSVSRPTARLWRAAPNSTV